MKREQWILSFAIGLILFVYLIWIGGFTNQLEATEEVVHQLDDDAPLARGEDTRDGSLKFRNQANTKNIGSSQATQLFM